MTFLSLLGGFMALRGEWKTLAYPQPFSHGCINSPWVFWVFTGTPLSSHTTRSLQKDGSFLFHLSVMALSSVGPQKSFMKTTRRSSSCIITSWSPGSLVFRFSSCFLGSWLALWFSRCCSSLIQSSILRRR
eukprot:Rmarinus@m.5318